MALNRMISIIVAAGQLAGTIAATVPDTAAFAAMRSSAAQVQGWTEQTEKYRFFAVKDLFDLIDGGAEEYKEHGCINGIVMSLSADSGRSADLYIENFGSAGRAKSMVSVKRKSASNPQPVPGARNKNAFFDEVIGGCMVYLCNDRYYIEMTLTGYGAPGQAALDAKRFIERIQTTVLRNVKP